MKHFKYLILSLMFVFSSCLAAADEWLAYKLDSGEVVYNSGHFNKLFVGPRGMGFRTMEAIHDRDIVTISVDGGKPIRLNLMPLAILSNLYVFNNSKELLPQVMTAKRLEVKFGSCGNFFRGYSYDCMLSREGESYTATWEFERTLGEVMSSKPAEN